MIDEETGEITPTVPFIRTRYNYDTNIASDMTALKCEDPTLAQQQFKDECDINVILEKFGITGEMPQSVKVPLNGDFTDAMTYQESLHVMMEAEEAFMKMSSAVRKRFDNDPGLFVDWASSPDNLEEARALGLAIEAKAMPEPMVVRVMKEPDGPGPGPV